MKTNLLFVGTVVVLALFVTACGGQPSSIPDAVEDAATAVSSSTQVTGAQTAVVDDIEGLANALRTAGATVESGDEVEQEFFTAAGKILKVNGADVQVFVYDTAEAMEAEAAQVAEDGGSIGTSMVTWMGPPHFYKLGRMIVLYVGDDSTVKALLEGVFGPQFAGR